MKQSSFDAVNSLDCAIFVKAMAATAVTQLPPKTSSFLCSVTIFIFYWIIRRRRDSKHERHIYITFSCSRPTFTSITCSEHDRSAATPSSRLFCLLRTHSITIYQHGYCWFRQGTKSKSWFMILVCSNYSNFLSGITVLYFAVRSTQWFIIVMKYLDINSSLFMILISVSIHLTNWPTD